MTSRAGEPFQRARAVAEAEELLAAPVRSTGPTVARGVPLTGEWSATDGAGFRIVPLWEGPSLTGVYGREWNDAEDAAEGHLVALADELDRRWGPHRTIQVHTAVHERQTGGTVGPLFEALFSQDLYGDLTVWGPVGPAGRWFAVTVGHSDGDAPLVLAALVGEGGDPGVGGMAAW
ncbi:hypothetical protein [Streptomyces sp. cmx-18-6]|uniref:hypothetical protein n=1 Tax=Streptomyces sp. cmx-18-6 TaxID=2790930 RepID=UPI00397F50A9